MDDLNPFFAAARQQPRDISRMELGLETRVLAHIRAKRGDFQQPSRIANSLWKWLLPAFACCALVSGFWNESVWQTADDTVFRAISPQSNSADAWIF